MAVIPLCVMNVMINITQHHWIFSFSNFFEPHFKIAVCYSSVIQTRAIHGSTYCVVLSMLLLFTVQCCKVRFGQLHTSFTLNDQSMIVVFDPSESSEIHLPLFASLFFVRIFIQDSQRVPLVSNAILISFGSRCGSFKFRYII